MSQLSSVWTIARWELKKSMTSMGRNVLPLAVGLLVLLVLVTGFAAEQGIHLQDGMYRIGADDPDVVRIVAGDERFTVYQDSAAGLWQNRYAYDVIVIGGEVYAADTGKGRSALKALERDYSGYVSWVANAQPDLFAAYPLWIDIEYVQSELDFVATESGQQVGAPADLRSSPKPDGPVAAMTPPSSAVEFSPDDLREHLAADTTNTPLTRYTDILTADTGMETFKTPSQLSPPLPFDSIILIFVFIFPLYFTAQFFMMSIMNERIGRVGEALLSAPVRPAAILLGKSLPYLAIMLLIAAIITLMNGASLLILLPLFPVILFFMASALIIGMAARSFKELSFLSIFFSTLVTSYLFFPTVFANVHIVSIISPLTLVVLQLQGDGFTAAEYVYSTSLFFATSLVLFYAGVTNFNEERLFSQERLLPRLMEFVASGISNQRPLLSLGVLAAFSVPFVFMVQMMCLVLFFNMPMPLSLILLIGASAFIEELAKSIGLYAVVRSRPGFLTVKNLVAGAFLIALGFLIGEKVLLLATLTQITESVFGEILFLSLQVLWMPLLLHFAGVLIVALYLKIGGSRFWGVGLLTATMVHAAYNLYFMGGLL